MFIPHLLLTGALALIGVLNTLFQSSAVLFNSPSLGLLADVPILAYFISYEISVSSLPAPVQILDDPPEDDDFAGDQCIWGIPGLLVPRGVMHSPSPPVLTTTPSGVQNPTGRKTSYSNVTAQQVCLPMVLPMCQHGEITVDTITPSFLLPQWSPFIIEEQASWVHKMLHVVFLIFSTIFLCTSVLVFLVGGIDLGEVKVQEKAFPNPPITPPDFHQYEETPSISESLTLVPTDVTIPAIDDITSPIHNGDTTVCSISNNALEPLKDSEGLMEAVTVSADFVAVDNILAPAKEAMASAASPESTDTTVATVDHLESVKDNTSSVDRPTHETAERISGETSKRDNDVQNVTAAMIYLSDDSHTHPPKRSRKKARTNFQKRQEATAAATIQPEPKSANKPRPRRSTRISTDTINRTVFRHLQPSVETNSRA
ncbi:hypothetical protein QCA50_006167 [Cerrena zonata]|uniref:Uncharacterized protein n=1 Tax=Cerrena zonata TaxID=2478898 RepID=A0AAW0GH33_9APHY